MEEITQFLKQLISLPGLSGFETPVREVISQKWHPLVDELSVSKLGSLHGLRRASGSERPTVFFAAHMDAIGLMVTSTENGFIHVTHVGGLDPRILPGQAVTVHGRRDLPGVIVLWPDRLLNSNHKNNSPTLSRLLVDIGLDPAEVYELVEVGDLISFATPPMELTWDTLAGHSLDNRASVAALTLCLEELHHIQLEWNVVAGATVFEEVNAAGAATSTFSLQPDLAVAIDVTYGKGPGATDYRSFALGKGPSIGVGANIHPYLLKLFKEVAEESDIPYAIEPMAISSGTDAMAMQIVAAGIPTMVIGIPLRYMHTPVEVVSWIDIQRTGHLLAGFVKKLNNETLNALEKEMML